MQGVAWKWDNPYILVRIVLSLSDELIYCKEVTCIVGITFDSLADATNAMTG